MVLLNGRNLEMKPPHIHPQTKEQSNLDTHLLNYFVKIYYKINSASIASWICVLANRVVTSHTNNLHLLQINIAPPQIA